MNTLTQHVLDILRSPIQSLHSATQTQRAAVYTSSAAVILYTLVTGYNDYQAWKAIGPGGLPYNPLGWLVQCVARLLTTTDMTSTGVYETPKAKKKYENPGATSYLDEPLPFRNGVRPNVPLFVAPQRQARGQSSTVEMQKHQDALIRSIVAAHPTLLHIHDSRLENHGDAIFLRPDAGVSLPPGNTACKGEIAHFHLSVADVSGWHGEADGSGHCTLSLQDAKMVVERGWGQRHRASGIAGYGVGFTFLYAPRDGEELEVVERILRASVGYMTGGVEIK